MTATGIVTASVCSDCIHHDVCKITNVEYDVANELSNVMANYGEVICNFAVDLKCHHFHPNPINIRNTVSDTIHGVPCTCL